MAPQGVCVANWHFVRLLVLPSACAPSMSLIGELPVFGRVVQAFLRVRVLLSADVQHELEHDGAGVREHALEVVDVPKALVVLLAGDPG